MCFGGCHRSQCVADLLLIWDTLGTTLGHLVDIFYLRTMLGRIGAFLGPSWCFLGALILIGLDLLFFGLFMRAFILVGSIIFLDFMKAFIIIGSIILFDFSR